MTTTRHIAVVVGSLRRDGYSRRLANALGSLAPDGLAFREVGIGDLPLYNEDLDKPTDLPPAWARFRADIAAADAVLFVTPEYNRSIPGGLKNAIDVGSRPYGKSVFANKPAAVLSQSIGAIGGFGANHHLRQCLVFLDMPVLQQPEAYLGGSAALFDDSGALANEGTREFLGKFITAFATLIERCAK